MSAYSFDVEQFIVEVKKRPELWDTTSENYRHRSRKDRAWSEIAALFIEEFDEMLDIDRIDVIRKLFNKWRNLRDSYVRNVKRKYAKKGYVYAKNLEFLSALYKRSSGSEDDGEAETDSQPSDEPIKKLTFKTFQDLNDSHWSDADDTPLTIDNLKRKRVSKTENKVEYVDAPFTDTNFTAEDEDRSFFESLLPAVREFDLDQKLEFRSQAINLVKRIRNVARNIKVDPVDYNED